ncbi:MAG: hypothetical protein EOO58_00230, partial [Hymenobacter sp.]
MMPSATRMSCGARSVAADTTNAARFLATLFLSPPLTSFTIMDDERGMGKIMDLMRLFAVVLTLLHLYYYCYGFFTEHHITAAWFGNILSRFSTKTALFHAPYVTKGAAVLLLTLACLGTRGKPSETQTWPPIIAYLVLGAAVFFGNGFVLSLAYSPA